MKNVFTQAISLVTIALLAAYSWGGVTALAGFVAVYYWIVTILAGVFVALVMIAAIFASEDFFSGLNSTFDKKSYLSLTWSVVIGVIFTVIYFKLGWMFVMSIAAFGAILCVLAIFWKGMK